MSHPEDTEPYDFVQRLPKTETHLHIEGALPFHLLQDLHPERYREPPASWAPDFKFVSFKQFEDELLDMALKGSSTFSVVLAQYPLLRRRNLSTYFERYYRNV